MFSRTPPSGSGGSAAAGTASVGSTTNVPRTASLLREMRTKLPGLSPAGGPSPVRGESGGGDDGPAIGGDVGGGICAACTCTTCAGVYAGGSSGPPVPACVDCRHDQ
jgi:hypothetical protein